MCTYIYVSLYVHMCVYIKYIIVPDYVLVCIDDWPPTNTHTDHMNREQQAIQTLIDTNQSHTGIYIYVYIFIFFNKTTNTQNK